MRRKTLQIPIGNILIGSEYPIIIQSMTNTLTSVIQCTVNQCI